jgi:uncharacterized delta-60 repeat protein
LEDRTVPTTPGTLDPTFGSNGTVTTSFVFGEYAQSLAVQPDGRIVAAGVTNSTFTGGLTSVALARYNSNGSLDTSFGSGGKVTTSSSLYSGANSVALQPDGHIVVAGFSHDTVSGAFLLVRYNSDGSLDTTFGTSGKVTTTVGGPGASATGLAIQSDGRVVVTGITADSSGVSRFTLARYNSNGNLDTSFGSSGFVNTSFGGSSASARSLAIQPDGHILAAGSAHTGPNGGSFALARYNSDGSLDSSFGSSGLVTTSFDPSGASASSLVVQADGRIGVAGSTLESNSRFALARYTSNGGLDTSFGTAGRVTTSFGGQSAEANSVAVQRDGHILAAGSTAPDNNHSNLALARYNSDGSLDSSFGSSGLVTLSFGSTRASANGVAVQPDGRIVTAGSTSPGNNGSSGYFALARFEGVALPSTAGVFSADTAMWFLRNSNSAGLPDAGVFTYGNPGWLPVVGDWDGDGSFTAGVVDPATATWYLRNENSSGAPDAGQFQYGLPGWIPVAGDWSHTGHSGIGMLDPATATWYLRNEVSAGAPDAGTFSYGAPGWVPVPGDWDGNGTTTAGVFSPATGTWYLRNSNSAGAPDAGTFSYGLGSWTPVVGDWTGSGASHVGVVDPATNTWYLRSSNSGGAPDAGIFLYGAPGWKPFAGSWVARHPLAKTTWREGAEPLSSPAEWSATVAVALARLTKTGAGVAALAPPPS